MSNSWPIVSLGELIREEREQIGSIDGDALPVLGVTNVDGVTQTGVKASDNRSKYLRLRPGRFVYNPYRINVGSLGLSGPTQNGICSPAYIVFVPKERIDPSFLYLFLKSARGHRLINFHGNRGSVREALRFSDLCRFEIPLPPLAEQQRTVIRIQDIKAQISLALTLRQEAAIETEALISSKRQELIQEAYRFGEIRFDSAVRQLRGSSGLSLKDYQQAGRFPVIDQGQRFIAGYCDDTARVLRIMKPVVIWGDHTTKAKLVTFDFVPGADGTKVFQPKEGIFAEFLFHFLKSVRFPELGYSRHYRFLKSVRMPTPPPREQLRIVTELDALQAAVDNLNRLQAETTIEMEALLPSVLDRAFKGEL